MDFGIIAAGEGSRLAKEGFPLPKPLVSLKGESLIERLIRIFMSNDARAIYIVINKHSPRLEKTLRRLMKEVPLHIIKKDTPSSLHSLGELLKAHPYIKELCLTTTDTVFAEREFGQFLKVFGEDPSVDALMGVTSFVDDESPLYIKVNPEREIEGFSDMAAPFHAHVSGGIYCLRSNALQTARKAIEQQMERMRNYQKMLLDNKLNVRAYSFSQIVDIDHIRDIQVAEAFLEKLNRAETVSR